MKCACHRSRCHFIIKLNALKCKVITFQAHIATHIHKHSQTNLPSTTQTKLEPSFHGFSLHHGLDAANHQDYGSFQNCACAFSEAAVHRDGSPHDKCSGSSNHPSHVKGAVKCVRGGGLCVVCSWLCCGRFLLWCVVC